MPSFTVDFEVFCGTCGAGLCNQSDTRKSRQRGEDQVTVDACEKCVGESYDKGYDKGAASRDEEIDNLVSQMQELQAELESWRS